MSFAAIEGQPVLSERTLCVWAANRFLRESKDGSLGCARRVVYAGSY